LAARIDTRDHQKRITGLKKFYMIGQWVMPGGGVTSGLTMVGTSPGSFAPGITENFSPSSRVLILHMGMSDSGY